MVRYERVYEIPNPRGNEIAALRQEIGQLPYVTLEDLQRLQSGNEFWCTNCGSRIRDPSQKQCGRCGSETASKSPKYRCTACSSGVDPSEVRCACGNDQAILSTALGAESKPDGRYRCVECKSPVNPDSPSCTSCGSTKAFQVDA